MFTTELKEMLEMAAKLPNFAFDVLIAFGIYKLIMYLSGVGAFVTVSKLLINKVHDAYLRPKPPQEQIFNFDGTYMIGTAENHLKDIIRDLARNGYSSGLSREASSPQYNYYRANFIHSEDMVWLKEAVTEHVKKVGYPKYK